MQSHREVALDEVKEIVERNLLSLCKERLIQGFHQFMHTSAHIVEQWQSHPIINISSIPKAVISKVFGPNFIKNYHIYGKDKKIYYDAFPLYMGDKKIQEPALLPPGKYCYTVLERPLHNGVNSQELRVRTAGPSAHYWMVSQRDLDTNSVVGAGELFINTAHELVIAYPKTGHFQDIPFEQQARTFSAFFPTEYFESENYFNYTGNAHHLYNELAKKEVLALDLEAPPVMSNFYAAIFNAQRVAQEILEGGKLPIKRKAP